jgi:hypothetical protein
MTTTADATTELDRLAVATRAAEIVEIAIDRLNVPLARLPEALRQLGNAPAFAGGGVPRALYPVRDLLAELQTAAYALRSAVRAAQAVAPGVHRDAVEAVEDARLAVASWAIEVAETFLPAVVFFGSDADREEIAELAGACALDRTGWPWSSLAAINERLAEAHGRVAKEIRLTARGCLRAHALDMGQLRAAGMGSLVKRVEFECREQIASIRVAAGLEEIAEAG